MENVRVQKGKTIKTIPAEYKKDYINAGWGEVQEPTKSVGVSSSKIYGNN
jgi:hypothetical protein